MNEPNENLIRAKLNIAARGVAEGRGVGDREASRDRLPPGQRLVKDGWPVLDLGITPEVSTAEWSLKVFGHAEEREFDWDAFMALPQTKLVTDFHCVTTWSIYDAAVEGVLWKDFLGAINVAADATHVMFHAHDGYTINLPLRELAEPGCAIIYSYDGAPLGKSHGGPARIWVPHLYGWKSAKWVKAVEFLPEDRKGFWEVRGYHNHGDPWKEERYS